MEYIHQHNNHLDLQLTVTVNNTNDDEEQKQKEKEDKMKCTEQSSMPAHDDGCGNFNPSKPSALKRSTSSYMNLEEDADVEEEKSVEVC